MYPSSTTSSFTSPKEGFASPSRDGKDSPRLQEVLKAERLSPMGGGGSSFLNLTSPAGGVYGPSPHMMGPYGSYMATSQDYSSAALYSTAGPWMNPSYSPKLRNKMRLSPPGKTSWESCNLANVELWRCLYVTIWHNYVDVNFDRGTRMCQLWSNRHPSLASRWNRPLPLQRLRTVP